MTEARQYLSCAATAKIIRAALKESFPKVKFSVRSHTYAGGASIDISYQDGPSVKLVEAVVQKFEAASFDGMQDLKTYNRHTYEGREVHFGADYIFVKRKVSHDALSAAKGRAEDMLANDVQAYCDAVNGQHNLVYRHGPEEGQINPSAWADFFALSYEVKPSPTADKVVMIARG